MSRVLAHDFRVHMRAPCVGATGSRLRGALGLHALRPQARQASGTDHPPAMAAAAWRRCRHRRVDPSPEWPAPGAHVCATKKELAPFCALPFSAIELRIEGAYAGHASHAAGRATVARRRPKCQSSRDAWEEDGEPVLASARDSSGRSLPSASARALAMAHVAAIAAAARRALATLARKRTMKAAKRTSRRTVRGPRWLCRPAAFNARADHPGDAILRASGQSCAASL